MECAPQLRALVLPAGERVECAPQLRALVLPRNAFLHGSRAGQVSRMELAPLCRELDRPRQRLPVQPQHSSAGGFADGAASPLHCSTVLLQPSYVASSCGGRSRDADSYWKGKRFPKARAKTRPLPRILAKPGRCPPCQAWFVSSLPRSIGVC